MRHLNQLWDLAVVFGGLSIVAHAIAKGSWKAFEAALKDDLTRDTGDIASLWEWDFEYWHRIGHAAAGLSILCSVLWLISRLQTRPPCLQSDRDAGTYLHRLILREQNWSEASLAARASGMKM